MKASDHKINEPPKRHSQQLGDSSTQFLLWYFKNRLVILVWIVLYNCPAKCLKLLFTLSEMKASLWGYNFKCLLRGEREIIWWISQAGTLRIYVHVRIGKGNLRCHLQKIHVKLFLYQLPLTLSLFLLTFNHVISLLLTLTVFTLARSLGWSFSHSTQATLENVLKKIFFFIDIYGNSTYQIFISLRVYFDIKTEKRVKFAAFYC